MNSENDRPNSSEEFKRAIAQLFVYMAKKLNIKDIPKVVMVNDKENAKKLLGFTGDYNPETKTIRIYTASRWQKDQLRSFAHELIHHVQNERGDLSGNSNNDPKYAQNDPHLREMEKEAYLMGNLLFRDWSDTIKHGSGGG